MLQVSLGGGSIIWTLKKRYEEISRDERAYRVLNFLEWMACPQTPLPTRGLAYWMPLRLASDESQVMNPLDPDSLWQKSFTHESHQLPWQRSDTQDWSLHLPWIDPILLISFPFRLSLQPFCEHAFLAPHETVIDPAVRFGRRIDNQTAKTAGD